MTKVAIGIDIGGTSTKIGAVDENGTVHFLSKISTARYGDFDSFTRVIARTIQQEFNAGESYMELGGVGVGAPHGVRSRGTIEQASNLPWSGVLPLQQNLENLLGVAVSVTNDANAAAMGEKIFGGAKDKKDFVMLTLGTGLGAAYFSNGTLIEGFEGFAGELGHITYNYINGRHCRCGRRGCLETYVSATGIKRTVYKLLADHFGPSQLKDVSFNELSTKMISEHAKQGDSIAIEAFEYTGKVLGAKLAETVQQFNPQAIYLSGGLAQAGDYLFKPVKRHMEEHLMHVFKDKVEILSSELLPDQAPILGAAALVWNKLEKSDMVSF